MTSSLTDPFLRVDLPSPIPERIAALRRHRGYPVPWFVGDLDEKGQAVPVGTGTPDFRVIRPGGVVEAWTKPHCWVCGGRFESNLVTFAIGPMCSVNRVSAEPPSHLECASWSACACPFLSRPHMRRRDHDVPEIAERPAGEMIDRNPGVTLLWQLRRERVSIMPAPGGFLFRLGDPQAVYWFAEGRAATREECEESIRTGLPILEAEAERDGPVAVAQLEAQTIAAREFLPTST